MRHSSNRFPLSQKKTKCFLELVLFHAAFDRNFGAIYGNCGDTGAGWEQTHSTSGLGTSCRISSKSVFVPILPSKLLYPIVDVATAMLNTPHLRLSPLIAGSV